METMTRTPVDLVPAASPRRDPLVLARPPARSLGVHRARVRYGQRRTRRAELRKAWRVTWALIVGVVGGVTMYLMAMAGMVPLLEGEQPPAPAVSLQP